MMPDKYHNIPETEIRDRILEIKTRLGKRLLILGHHYQRDAVIALSDFRGDSYGLCKKAAEQTAAEFIVFCGVHFMAESADIISHAHQIVHLPDVTAGCPLADFADLTAVIQAWENIDEVCGRNVITPITYINSTAELKAFCGQNHGTVCTSSNAVAAFRWAFNQTEKIFFFPDQHLGTNTANKLGIPKQERIIWDPRQLMGGNSPNKIKRAKLILWPGHCHVHTWFTLDHIHAVRNSYPGIKTVVHPECPEPVVNAADDNGSTSYIIKYVQQSASNSTIAVGTELNLVQRLAQENRDKKIIPLAKSLCPNMYKINLYNLCWTLENLGKINVIHVPQEIKRDALTALGQMLQLN